MNDLTQDIAPDLTVQLGSWSFDAGTIFRIAIVVGLMLLALVLVKVLMNRFIRRSSINLRLDATRLNFFRNALNGIIFLIGTISIIYLIPPLRAISTTLLASAGIFAAVLGFASQQAFSNIISGIFVVISRPFRVGDVIRVGRDGSNSNELIGTVEDITLRHTVIRDFQNRRIVIPNSVINMEVVTNNNIIDERVRRHINVTISYESDLEKAISIMQEESKKHPYYIDARTRQEIASNIPEVDVKVVSLSENGLQLRAYVWSNNFDQGWDLFCDLNRSIAERFRAEGIEIAYPHRVIIQKTES
jgi:small conductance mechanosensitive channel